MGIFLRGNQYWMRFNVDGKQERLPCGTTKKKLALDIFCKQKSLVAEGRYLDKKKEDKKMRFRDFADRYLEKHAKVYKKSWKSADLSYLNRLLPVFGDCYLATITSDKVTEYMLERQTKVKPASVNRELALLKVMYSKAEEWGLISQHPLRKVKRLKGETLGRTRYLTDEEIERLLKHCDKGLQEICITLIHTGMRKGELQKMEWKHADFDSSVLFIPVSKNGKSRYVPMNHVVKQLLLFKRLKRGENQNFIFGNTDGSIYNFRKAFETARRKSGLEEIRIHDLRHTFASHLVMKGVDLSTVQALLGHSDQRITERYSHLSPGHRAKAVSVLEELKSTVLAQSTADEQRYEFEEIISDLK